MLVFGTLTNYGPTLPKTPLIYGSSEMKKLISFAFSIPVSNAYCEGIFSIMTQLWSKERNRMTENLVKAELQVSLNYNMSCWEFYEYLKKNPELLRAAKGREKYKFKRRELGMSNKPLLIVA